MTIEMLGSILEDAFEPYSIVEKARYKLPIVSISLDDFYFLCEKSKWDERIILLILGEIPIAKMTTEALLFISEKTNSSYSILKRCIRSLPKETITIDMILSFKHKPDIMVILLERLTLGSVTLDTLHLLARESEWNPSVIEASLRAISVVDLSTFTLLCEKTGWNSSVANACIIRIRDGTMTQEVLGLIAEHVDNDFYRLSTAVNMLDDKSISIDFAAFICEKAEWSQDIIDAVLMKLPPETRDEDIQNVIKRASPKYFGRLHTMSTNFVGSSWRNLARM